MNEDERSLLRAWLRQARAARTAQEQARDARAVAARILALPAYREARVVMAYAAARGEIALDAVMEDALLRGKTLALPLCTGPGRMQARRVTALSRLTPGRYGIAEPDADCSQVAPETIDLILVPGVAFDARGGRLGQGGGYYDRFLAGPRAMRVGICHDFALVERVPTQAHDLAMDSIITPCGVVYPDRAKEE